MPTWNAVVLTCPNKNTSSAYQKELELRQQKGLIDKNALVISIEDPLEPIGSGGATLNAIYTVAETLSAKNKYRMTQIEVLRDCYILICHMGRSYPFDISGKAFATLPFQDEQTCNMLTNFDLIYNTMTNQVTGLNKETPHSDPGVYVCSTDMLFLVSSASDLLINNAHICVLSTKTSSETAKANGIYQLDDSANCVKNIHYMPDDLTLQSISSSKEKPYNLISGVVYFSFEVVKLLYGLLMYSPLDACSYMGIDSGASPLCLSLFFDILMACCSDVNKEEYLNGSFKTNHLQKSNQKSILRSARMTLWNSLHERFQIKNITVGGDAAQCVYMDNATFEHRASIFSNLTNSSSFVHSYNADSSNLLFINSLIESNVNSPSRSVVINSILLNSNLKLNGANLILNSDINSSEIELGENTVLSDIVWKDKKVSIDSNIFVQNVSVNLECLNMEVNLNIVFGTKDNFMLKLDETNLSSFRIFNETWSTFKEKTTINEFDLWPNNIENRTLFNAKLYSLLHSGSCESERNELSEFFWLNSNKSQSLVSKWRNSLRLSIEDIVAIINLEKLFTKRKSIFNKINSDLLVKCIVENRVIQFTPLIRNAVYDGYANDILKKLDEAALKATHDLVLLPRLMAFISITLSEMALEYSTLRSGPSQNANWLDSFQLIENGQIKQAISALSKERQNWMTRNDLLIRASRHYEGAMLAFIRQATASFKSQNAELNRIILEPFELKKEKSFNWVEANSPARLDLAGAWSDTPPITYECNGGSCVTNVAILVNDKKPIGARARVVKNSGNQSVKITMQESADDPSSQVSFEFFDLNDFKDYNKPQATACLMKAVFVFTKLIELDKSTLNDQLLEKINGSLELVSWTGLPHGSGLGTSSILIACVLKVVWYLMGIKVSNETLSYSVLIVEQMMTTNGGWQDQIGGIYGGFKETRTKNCLPLEMSVKELKLSPDFIELVNSRLVLIYTGITRLAKDLLLNVLRNWYGISKKIYDNVDSLVLNGQTCCQALEKSNLEELGNCINKHREQKLVMAPGSEPESVRELIQLIEPYVYGMALAGAGGGGFLYCLTKDSTTCKQKIKHLIDASNLNMKIYTATISLDGIEFNFI